MLRNNAFLPWHPQLSSAVFPSFPVFTGFWTLSTVGLEVLLCETACSACFSNDSRLVGYLCAFCTGAPTACRNPASSSSGVPFRMSGTMRSRPLPRLFGNDGYRQIVVYPSDVDTRSVPVCNHLVDCLKNIMVKFKMLYISFLEKSFRILCLSDSRRCLSTVPDSSRYVFGPSVVVRRLSFDRCCPGLWQAMQAGITGSRGCKCVSSHSSAFDGYTSMPMTIRTRIVFKTKVECPEGDL